MKYEKTISTGFQSLDEILRGGFHGGSLSVIAARPGMGKTKFALQCATGMAKNTGKRIYFFLSKLYLDYVIRGCVKEDFKEFCIHDSIIFDSTAPLTVSQIRTKLAGISDLGAVVIDSFHQLQLRDNTCEQNAARVNKVARELALIAREFDIPVICAPRLPWSPEERRDRRSFLRDLAKISGGLEQYADVILFLYRHAYYNYDMDYIENLPGAEIIVAKNRFGDRKALSFHFDGKFSEE